MTNNFATRLKLLRENSGLSLSELGEKVGVAKQTIFKYEHGDALPSTTTVYSLSKAFDVHPSTLFAPDEIKLTIGNIKFREESFIMHKQEHLSAIKEICKDYLKRFIEIKQLLQEPLEFANPLEGLDEISTKKHVEKAAKTLRRRWKLGSAPITDVVQMVEDNGIAVIEVELDDSFSGLSGNANEEVQFMVINKNCSDVTRKRFTALHELGHIILEFAENLPESVIESLCNHFAGAILLVEESILHEFGKNRHTISLSELKRIKEKYGASIKAIIMRAKVIGFISEETSNDWWNSYSEWNDVSNKGHDFGKYFSSEHPTLLNNLIVKGINEQKITWGKAAELKGTSIDKLEKELEEVSFCVQ